MSGKNKIIPEKESKPIFERVDFTPGKDALSKADTAGFKAVGTTIVDGLVDIIMQERVVIVENALTMIKKHEQAISKMKPGQEALINSKRVQIQEACFTSSQIKELEEMERKRNSIAIALNAVQKTANREKFEALKVATEKFKVK